MEFPVSEFLVAPFWSDIDTTSSGTIQYEKHTEGAVLSRVSEFLSRRLQVAFTGAWMLVAEWKMVPEFDTADVNVVRVLFDTLLNCLCTKQCSIEPFKGISIHIEV